MSCFFSRRSAASDLTVRVGSSSPKEGGEMVKVIETIRHDKYNSKDYDFDFALLKLEKNLTWSDKINYIDMPRENDVILNEGDLCNVSGFGKYELNNGFRRKKVNLRFASQQAFLSIPHESQRIFVH